MTSHPEDIPPPRRPNREAAHALIAGRSAPPPAEPYETVSADGGDLADPVEASDDVEACDDGEVSEAEDNAALARIVRRLLDLGVRLKDLEFLGPGD
jgi:hypothetical protein